MPLARDVDLKDGQLRGIAGGLMPVRMRGVPFAFNGTAAPSYGTDGKDPEGSGRSIAISQPQAATGIAGYRDRIYGRVVGVRIDRVTTAPFDVVIDGVVYRIDNPQSLWHNVSSQFTTDIYGILIIDDNLSLDYHTVELYASINPDATSTNTVRLFGWIADENSGYARERAKFAYPFAAVAITTSATLITYNTAATEVIVSNVDSAPHLLTITDQNNTLVDEILIQPRRRWSLKLGGLVEPSVKLAADVNSVLNYKVMYA